MSDEPRPWMLHLAGGAVPCCGGWFLMDCDGVYKCPCGKRQEARAQKIIRSLGILDGASRLEKPR